MSTTRLFFAGSGGQGVLMMGQLIAYAAMHEGKQVTFIPSYGPEMRGGTANCTVVVSDKDINCPLINEADAVAVMNLPSLIKFEPLLARGGRLFINESLVEQEPTRNDIKVYKIPAAEVAAKIGNQRAGNLIMLGDIVRETGVVSDEAIDYALHKVFSGAKEKLYKINREAFEAYREEK